MNVPRPLQTPSLEVRDRFSAPLPAGDVIGSRSESGALRLGLDVEGRLAIDHGALRVGCLAEPGWGRQALAYGPHSRRAGLTGAVVVLNGHHASATVALEGWEAHVQRLGWRVRGEVREALRARLGWIRPLAARLERRRAHPNHYRWPPIEENLAVGWFPEAVGGRPGRGASTFAVRAAGPSCGTLCASVNGRLLPLLDELPNLPLALVVVLRPEGAAYYAASLEGARGLPAPPSLRPLAIDPGSRRGAGWQPRPKPTAHQEPSELGPERRSTVFLGLRQSVLGEIGFRVDSRVERVEAAQVPAWSAWFSTAHAADALIDAGSADHSVRTAEVGGAWSISGAPLAWSSRGLQATSGPALALLRPSAPSGLLAVQLERELRGRGAAGLVWRARSPYTHWAVRVDRRGAALTVCEDGREELVAHDPRARLRRWGAPTLQVLDDGRRFRVALEGHPLFGGPRDDERLGQELGVGVLAAQGVRLRRFEAHPRAVQLPSPLQPPALWSPAAGEARVRDDFSGPARPLAGKLTLEGNRRWRRDHGRGHVDISEGVARVRATPSAPNPGRTLYTVPWDEPDFVDLEVGLIAPGTAQGQGQLARGGLVLWQDPDHYVVLNEWNDDRYGGASVSTFYRLGGKEDVYDAVWTNVGQRIVRGRPHTLRLTSDGLRLLVRVDDEPVLYRALTDVYPWAKPLHLRRVGLAVNWEFGDDTGTVFRRFVARGAR